VAPSSSWANQTVVDQVVADQAAVVAQNDLRKIQTATPVDTLWMRPIFAVLLATA
jgi:hypothetical protein